jgi:uncharacterized membrane protein
MTLSVLLILHICGAIIGLLSGWTALFFRKGSRPHGAAGNVFFLAMLTMSASAACIAFTKQELINSIVGVLTFYLVATAWLTVRRKAGEIGLLEFGAMLGAFADGVAAWIFGVEAAHSAAGIKDGYPAAAYFIFGSVAILAAAGDVRMLVRGPFSGAGRIARHLWRMCLALLITTMSFFLGKQRLFPEAVLRTHLNLVPIIANAAVMIFWLCRVLFTNRYKSNVTASPIETVSANTLA